MSRAYYNENDQYCAAWLRNLIAAGHIMAGDVDGRSIVDVRPSDVAGYTRCHFFAGIGVWDYALGLAGWPTERPVWTGSCPCQPFSAAGRRAGFDDERHLWPAWFDLIRECGPDVVFGEQVEAAVRLGWLDAVLSDLEAAGYACGATVFGAHSVGAPHIRQRLWFVADANGEGRAEWAWLRRISARRTEPSHNRQLDDATGPRFHAAAHAGLPREEAGRAQERGWTQGRLARSSGACNPWFDADWLPCRDGKTRPVEPGTFPLAHGAPARMVLTCASCETETVIGDDGLCAVRRVPAGYEGRISPEVLLRSLHGDEHDEEASYGSGRPLSGAASLRGQGVRALRQDGASSASASPGRESDQQRSGQHRNPVRDMPRAGAPQAASGFDMRRVRQPVHGSLSPQSQQDLFCPVCSRVGSHFRKEEMGSRVGALRAYGNAIVPQAAAAFVGAYLEATPPTNRDRLLSIAASAVSALQPGGRV